MRSSRTLVLLGIVAATLVGCSASVDAAPTLSASAPAASPAPTGTVAAPSPSASAQEATLTLSLDRLTAVVDGASEEVAIADGEAIVALMTRLSGVEPQTSDIEDPWGNGDFWGTRYEWPGAIVALIEGRASLTVRAARIGDVPVSTAAGIAVGSTRAAALAAQAFDEWDEDDDGIADHLGIEGRDVAGTTSLVRPGEVGIEFIGLDLDGDLVTAIYLPANDYSDI
ncbi:hypothetical protein [Microbacterium sp. P04]|uniref:hypothetical protein n=1 Tax=Microbacterium sp. P04 TaxID=3366947 RepID=UPI0037477460